MFMKREKTEQIDEERLNERLEKETGRERQ